MAVDRGGTAETLHRMCGAVEVARDMIERSTGLYCGGRVLRDGQILSALTEAADALSAVAEALGEALRRTHVGPAA